MRELIKELYLPTNIETKKFYPGLNASKGLLVLLVVFTHCLPPGMILYFLYFFHMPLFMAISGFLLKTAAFENGYIYFIKRLWHRLLLPWLLASILFIPIHLTEGQNTHLKFSDLIYPYYHLWYIPSYIIGATICFYMHKLKISAIPILIITAGITILWYLFYRDKDMEMETLPLYWLGEKRLFAYLFFFIIGFTLRNGYIKNKLLPVQLLFIKAIAFGALLFLIFKQFSSLYIVWPYLFFNTTLIVFILMYIGPKNILQTKLLLLINKQSLGIYLYHPLVLTLICILLKDRDHQHISNLQATILFMVVMALTLALVWLLKKWRFTNIYVLGNKEAK